VARFALRISKNSDLAISTLRQGMEAIPNDIQIPMTLAEIYGLVGQHQEAVSLYEDLLNRNPGLDVVANNMAEIIADFQFDNPQALERARRVAERFQGSNNPLFLDTLGWIYVRQGSLNPAIATLEKAVSSGEVPAQVHYHYGVALAKLGRKDQAKVQLELATKGGRNYPGIEEARKLLQTL
jgi:tetratricopeptide (TPR) repeat protein